MRSRWSNLLSVAVLVIALGLHWSLLQSVAWITMFSKFAATTNLSSAISKTFDGTSPCALCRVVEQGKRTQKPSETVAPIDHLDLFLVRSQPPTFPAPSLLVQSGHRVIWHARSASPPLPPPRSV